MKRSELEKYLGKKVKVTIFDSSIADGILHKTGEDIFKNDPNLYLPQNYYFVTNEQRECISFLFKSSHVKKLREE